jgi:hypothetical protein
VTRLLRSFVVFVVVLLVAPAARADEATARQYFKKGVELYDAKQYGPALEAFQQAYREKPSGGIKQNIALSLKGLGRTVEAATAFDEALDEGKTTLRPETRAAIERELAELSKIVATVNLTIVGDDKKPLEADVTVDGVMLSRGAVNRPIRLAQGIHIFRARAQGFPDPPEKKLALRAGEPVDAMFVIGHAPQEQGFATLTVKTKNPDAVIRVDGVEVGKGTYTASVNAGRHEVQVSAPGHKTTSVDVVLSAGASVEYPVELHAIGDAPEPYGAPERKEPPREKKFYVTIMAGLESASYRTSPTLGEPVGGSRRPYVGGLLGVRLGGYVAKGFALELGLMAGAVNAKYRVAPGAVDDTSTTIGHWQITPGIRWHTPGKVRFVLGTGVGLHGVSVNAKVPIPGRIDERTGKGVAFSWLADVGMQIQLGGVSLEIVAFTDVHGIGPVRDPSGNRLLLSSPAVRGGGRIGVMIPF